MGCEEEDEEEEEEEDSLFVPLVSKYGSLIVRSGCLNPSSICPQSAPASLNLSAICPDERTSGKIED